MTDQKHAPDEFKWLHLADNQATLVARAHVVRVQEKHPNVSVCLVTGEVLTVANTIREVTEWLCPPQPLSKQSAPSPLGPDVGWPGPEPRAPDAGWPGPGYVDLSGGPTDEDLIADAFRDAQGQWPKGWRRSGG